jgi:hypothetical protein
VNRLDAGGDHAFAVPFADYLPNAKSCWNV